MLLVMTAEVSKKDGSNKISSNKPSAGSILSLRKLSFQWLSDEIHASTKGVYCHEEFDASNNKNSQRTQQATVIKEINTLLESLRNKCLAIDI